MKLQASILSLISLLALPAASFAGQPNGGGTSTVAFGGTAIPGGTQSSSYVISKPGAYYLAGDLSMSADVSAIIVNVPDVTVDLNGCTISFSTGSAANGIEIPSPSNVEIRNGSINDVPGDAIKTGNGKILRVTDVHVAHAGKAGLNSSAGLTTVDRSEFVHCGTDGVSIVGASGFTRVKNTTTMGNGRVGIYIVASPGSEIIDCRSLQNQWSGIYAFNTATTVANNSVHGNNLAKSASHAGILVGGWCSVKNNVLSQNFINGIVTTSGTTIAGNMISLTPNAANDSNLGNAISVPLGTALYRDNQITPSTNALVGSLVNGGGNVLY